MVILVNFLDFVPPPPPVYAPDLERDFKLARKKALIFTSEFTLVLNKLVPNEPETRDFFYINSVQGLDVNLCQLQIVELQGWT